LYIDFHNFRLDWEARYFGPLRGEEKRERERERERERKREGKNQQKVDGSNED